ncbi:MAG: hypothetical protein M3146_03390 [Thermoproteota archaeon]|nr:hypothetical protein [Thermoproteota archaeon]
MRTVASYCGCPIESVCMTRGTFYLMVVLLFHRKHEVFCNTRAAEAGTRRA